MSLTEIKPIAKQGTSNQSPENHRCLVQIKPFLKSDLRKVFPFTPFSRVQATSFRPLHIRYYLVFVF